VPSQTPSDPNAWKAATLHGPAIWNVPLSPVCLAVLDRYVQPLRREPRPVTELRLSEADRAVCKRELRPALSVLEEGCGFVVLDRVPLERYSPSEAQALYWLIGQGLGQPMEQNIQGTLLYDVRDTGQSVAYGARFSVTNSESTFHTDNSFGPVVADYVGLLCLQTARAGGLNQVVSGHMVYRELGEHQPEALKTLRQQFHIDRRGGVRPGEPPTIPFPIFGWDGDRLVLRYLRYWIEVGHEKAQQPLTPAQVRAMDELDRVASRPELRAEFYLERGQMLFVNNRWILHNRTAFEDHPEPERRRHYVRLWLQALPDGASPAPLRSSSLQDVVT
jgi:alpha-ketoglutarate-dependent taurine dioxygenase